jgi:RNase H-like domain found in reverse transcriptase
VQVLNLTPRKLIASTWPQPSTATNVRGFLGLTRYIATFLPALAEYTSVLTPLTNKECDKAFPPWTADHQATFEQIKHLVLSTDCLTVIDYEGKASNIYVTTDASDRRTGAVLSFGATWETACPVAYDSYQLNDTEKNYPVHEKELLAIVKALKKWRSHLLGARFEVFTDHRTLEYFQSQKEMSR